MSGHKTTRKPGRPRRTDQPATRNVTIRFTEEEHRLLEVVAAASGRRVGPFLRILGQAISGVILAAGDDMDLDNPEDIIEFLETQGLTLEPPPPLLVSSPTHLRRFDEMLEHEQAAYVAGLGPPSSRVCSETQEIGDGS